MSASVQSCKQAVVRVSGSDGGSAADPERAMPAVAAPAAKAPHKPDKRRLEGQTSDAAAADADADDRGAPSVASPGKRHRAAAAGAPSGDEAVTAHAALGAAEAEAGCGAGGALEDEARAALRRMGVHKNDPRFAAALAAAIARERAGHAKQVRYSFLGSSWLHPKALCRACCAQRYCESDSALQAARVGSVGQVVVSLTRQGKRVLQCDTPC
jgi:hypothetical protein